MKKRIVYLTLSILIMILLGIPSLYIRTNTTSIISDIIIRLIIFTEFNLGYLLLTIILSFFKDTNLSSSVMVVVSKFFGDILP